MSRHVATGCDGETENQILCACEAMQEDRRRRTYDLSYACTGAVCDRAQIVRTPMWEVGGISQETAAIARRAATEGGRLRPVRQIVDPISPVLRELFARTINGVLFQQDSQRAKRTIMRGSSNRELRVNIRYSAGDQPHAESVHHDMMIACIPIEPVIRRFEQSVSEQRSASWLDRPCQISLHP